MADLGKLIYYMHADACADTHLQLANVEASPPVLCRDAQMSAQAHPAVKLSTGIRGPSAAICSVRTWTTHRITWFQPREFMLDG